MSYDEYITGALDKDSAGTACKIYRPEKKLIRYIVFQAEYRVDYEGDEEVLVDFSDCVEFEPLTDEHGDTQLFLYNDLTSGSSNTNALAGVNKKKVMDLERDLKNREYQIVKVEV